MSKKNFVRAGLVFTLAGSIAWGQAPATSAAPQSATSGGTSTAEIKEVAPAKKWAGSATLYNYAGYVDKTSADATNAINVFYLGVGYKVTPNWKLSAVQRLRYDVAANSDKQKPVSTMPLRLEALNTNWKAAGAEGGTLYRVTVPTTVASRDDRMLFYVLINPSMTWKVGGPLELSYDFAYQSTSYSAPSGTTAPTGFATAADRMSHGISNAGVVTYNITDKFGVYQKLGYTFALRNSGSGQNADGTFKRGLSNHGNWVDLETGLNWTPAKSVAINAYLSQGHSVGQSDSIGLLATNSDTDFKGFAWMRAEQTSLELVTSFSF